MTTINQCISVECIQFVLADSPTKGDLLLQIDSWKTRNVYRLREARFVESNLHLHHHAEDDCTVNTEI